jgi:hypothetical protein
VMVVAAFISAIGAHGVASFQAHNGLAIHLFFAGLFFVGGMVAVLMSIVVSAPIRHRRDDVPSFTQTQRRRTTTAPTCRRAP